MNILTVCNMYPPYHIGGFELSTQDIVEGLRDCGHRVTVLTSTHGLKMKSADHGVLRWLPDPYQHTYKPDKLWRQELTSRHEVLRARKEVNPDLLLVTGLTGVSSGIFHWIKQLHVPTVYVAFDKYLLEYRELDRWFRFWNLYSSDPLKATGKRIGRWLLHLLNMPTDPMPRADGIWFGSYHLQTEYIKSGFTPRHQCVIYPLIPSLFATGHTVEARENDELRLLYVGRIDRAKGVHTILKALGRLKADGIQPLPKLSIVGKQLNGEYESYLLQLIQSLDLDSIISFRGFVQRKDMPALYASHDVVIFATEIAEHFGMVPLESMASGTAVISTATGGTAEYLRHGENALTFVPGDDGQLANHIRTLQQNEMLRMKLVDKGQQTARRFSAHDQWLEDVNEFLMKVIADNHSAGAADANRY